MTNETEPTIDTVVENSHSSDSLTTDKLIADNWWWDSSSLDTYNDIMGKRCGDGKVFELWGCDLSDCPDDIDSLTLAVYLNHEIVKTKTVCSISELNDAMIGVIK